MLVLNKTILLRGFNTTGLVDNAFSRINFNQLEFKAIITTKDFILMLNWVLTKLEKD